MHMIMHMCVHTCVRVYTYTCMYCIHCVMSIHPYSYGHLQHRVSLRMVIYNIPPPSTLLSRSRFRSLWLSRHFGAAMSSGDGDAAPADKVATMRALPDGVRTEVEAEVAGQEGWQGVQGGLTLTPEKLQKTAKTRTSTDVTDASGDMFNQLSVFDQAYDPICAASDAHLKQHGRKKLMFAPTCTWIPKIRAQGALKEAGVIVID